MRISSGTPNFDSLVERGFLAGSFILLYGPPHVGKSMFCRQFICEGLKEGEQCIYMTFDQSPNELRERLRKQGLNTVPYEDSHKLTIVDCYSRAEAGERYALKKQDDVDEINAVINELFQDLSKEEQAIGVRVVLDSISLPISAGASTEDLVKMIHSCKRNLPRQQNSMMIVMHEGMQDTKCEVSISHAMDVVIDMRSKDEENNIRRFIWVKAASNLRHSLQPHEYEITDSGLFVLSEKDEKTISPL